MREAGPRSTYVYHRAPTLVDIESWLTSLRESGVLHVEVRRNEDQVSALLQMIVNQMATGLQAERKMGDWE